MDTEEKIEIMKAYLEGQDIQSCIKDKEPKEWLTVHDVEWDWIHYEYRIKPIEENPLEAEIARLKSKIAELEDINAKLEQQIPKWIMLNDRSPEDGVLVYAKGEFLEGLYVLKDSEWYSKEELDDSEDGIFDNSGYDFDAITKWMPKPVDENGTETKSAWISVDVKLPEESVWVKAKLESESVQKMLYVNGSWYDSNEFLWDNDEDNVVAWKK